MFKYTSLYTVHESTHLRVSSYTSLLLYEAPLHRNSEYGYCCVLMTSFVILIVIMLSVAILNAIMMSVFYAASHYEVSLC